MAESSTPLEDYALLSDTRTAALVSKDGCVDWLCLPQFDSQAVFSRLLGEPQHGHWSIHVVDGEVESWRYLQDTFILETTWRSPTGTAVVTDFMPIHDEDQPDITDLVRKVRCTEGTVTVKTVLRLRFDYGSSTPYFRDLIHEGVDVVQAVAGPNAVYVRGPKLQQRAKTNCHSNTFDLEADDELAWVLTWAPSYVPHPPLPEYRGSLERTSTFWRTWAQLLPEQKEYNEEIRRSMLVLRALTDETTGGIVAAPTTSLPEEFGGERNWDYRYVWLRDSAMTIEALVSYGIVTSAKRWRTWLLRAIAGDAHELRVMYGLRGERHLPERELPHLPGYEDSAPVRVGNEAAEQYQADVVGEVMVALEKIREAGVEENEFSWNMQKSILDFQELRFNSKDQGIWEMRGDPHHFTHGRAMMWAAFDRGVRAAEKYGFDGPIDRWRELRDELAVEIMSKGFNVELNSFTQTYDTTTEDAVVDASLLQLAQIGFVAYDDPRMLGTVELIEKELLDSHGFLHRYRTDGTDGLGGGEYPFLICSFWLIEQYANSGRLDDAREMMERVVAVKSPLGLLAEEYSPGPQRQAGNFPQAFSHLGLVRAAAAIRDAEPSTESSRQVAAVLVPQHFIRPLP